MDNYVMRLVLLCVDELGRAKSREVARRLRLKVKYVSLVLTRCKRRGYVKREPYKRGREHGYVYWLTRRGVDWLVKKAKPKKKRASDLNTPSSPDLKSSNGILCFLMWKNLELKRQNQELSVSLERATWSYCNCSSERDFIYWQFSSLKSQLKCWEKEFQSLARLLTQKDKMILDLMQHIIESERRSKLHERGFSLKQKPHVEFKLPLIKKIDVQQLQKPKARETSFFNDIIKCVAEKLALRSWLTAMDQWSNWLPSPLGGGYSGDIFDDVTKAYCDELKGKTKHRWILKSYGEENPVPNEILRLPS